MSCTVFYKGTLKDKYDAHDVFDIVSKHTWSMNAKIVHLKDPIIIRFLHGKSESLILDLENKKIDGFCKWNGESTSEFYAVFDMFIELKSLFKSLKIEDDEGLWYEYIIQKQPCKIELKPLSSDGIVFFDRIKANEVIPITEIEQFIISISRFDPVNKSLLRVIVQDFIKILKIDNIDEFNPQHIVDVTNRLSFFGDGIIKEDKDSFSFHFGWMLIEIWISYAFEYQKMGVVKEVAAEVGGLMSSKIAAFEGIKSIFLNLHSGGASNSKEAEMRKLAKKYYKAGALGEVMVIDEPERELEFFFSMMGYLGLVYVGIK